MDGPLAAPLGKSKLNLYWMPGAGLSRMTAEDLETPANRRMVTTTMFLQPTSTGCLTKLELKEAALVGFSMGGGEVARYLGTYGGSRISKAVFISAVPAFLLKTSENANGSTPVFLKGLSKQSLQIVQHS